MAADSHFEIYKNRNNFWTVDPILAKLGRELQLNTAQTEKWSKMTFFKIQDGRRRQSEFSKKFNYIITD